jgi:hypothetical protein
MLYVALRPFVWAAIYSEAYRSLPGPHSPNSGEWLFLQVIGMCAAVIAGFVATYWSPPKSRVPIALLIVCSFASLLLTPFPFDASVFRKALYTLLTPAGLVIGHSLLRRYWAGGA